MKSVSQKNVPAPVVPGRAGNNFQCLKDDLLPEFDRCFSALIEDLAQNEFTESDAVDGDQRNRTHAKNW